MFVGHKTYKRYCIECGEFFTTNIPMQKYCCLECRKKHAAKTRITYRKAKKRWIKCKECGVHIETTRTDGFCCEDHKTLYYQRRKLKAKCKKCEYYLIMEDMCGYALRTRKCRYPNIYPCEVFKRKGEEDEKCKEVVIQSE